MQMKKYIHFRSLSPNNFVKKGGESTFYLEATGARHLTLPQKPQISQDPTEFSFLVVQHHFLYSQLPEKMSLLVVHGLNTKTQKLKNFVQVMNSWGWKGRRNTQSLCLRLTRLDSISAPAAFAPPCEIASYPSARSHWPDNGVFLIMKLCHSHLSKTLETARLQEKDPHPYLPSHCQGSVQRGQQLSCIRNFGSFRVLVVRMEECRLHWYE